MSTMSRRPSSSVSTSAQESLPQFRNPSVNEDAASWTTTQTLRSWILRSRPRTQQRISAWLPIFHMVGSQIQQSKVERTFLPLVASQAGKTFYFGYGEAFKLISNRVWISRRPGCLLEDHVEELGRPMVERIAVIGRDLGAPDRPFTSTSFSHHFLS